VSHRTVLSSTHNLLPLSSSTFTHYYNDCEYSSSSYAPDAPDADVNASAPETPPPVTSASLPRSRQTQPTAPRPSSKAVLLILSNAQYARTRAVALQLNALVSWMLSLATRMLKSIREPRIVQSLQGCRGLQLHQASDDGDRGC
jgi:hypothetical protein